MKKKFPRTAKDINGTVALAELRRAHLIIVILSITLAVIVWTATTQALKFESALSTIAIALLVIVALSSLATTITLSKISKK